MRGDLRCQRRRRAPLPGLLSRAPAAVGDVEDIIDRFGEYSEQLSDLVGNVTLYLAAEDLPAFAPDDDTIEVCT